MKKLLFILFIILVSCGPKSSSTEVKQDSGSVKIDSNTIKIPDLTPYCDTIKLKMKYLDGMKEVIDTASVAIRCGFISSDKPTEFAKVSGLVVKTSTGKEINPSDVTWSARKN